MRFREDFDINELARLILNAGVLADSTLEQMIAGERGRGDVVTVCMDVDPDDVISRFDDEAIIDRYSEIKGTANDRAIEDGIRYVRNGEFELARAMFACVFEGADFDAADRALS